MRHEGLRIFLKVRGDGDRGNILLRRQEIPEHVAAHVKLDFPGDQEISPIRLRAARPDRYVEPIFGVGAVDQGLVGPPPRDRRANWSRTSLCRARKPDSTQVKTGNDDRQGCAHPHLLPLRRVGVAPGRPAVRVEAGYPTFAGPGVKIHYLEQRALLVLARPRFAAPRRRLARGPVRARGDLAVGELDAQRLMGRDRARAAQRCAGGVRTRAKPRASTLR